MKIKKVEKLYIYINSNAEKISPQKQKKILKSQNTDIAKATKTIESFKTKSKIQKQEINYKIHDFKNTDIIKATKQIKFAK